MEPCHLQPLSRSLSQHSEELNPMLSLVTTYVVRCFRFSLATYLVVYLHGPNELVS
jgi:hypothetical protein